MGIAGFYIRLRVSETPIFAMLAEKKKTLKAPFFHVIKTAKKSMFITFCLGACASSVVGQSPEKSAIAERLVAQVGANSYCVARP